MNRFINNYWTTITTTSVSLSKTTVTQTNTQKLNPVLPHCDLFNKIVSNGFYSNSKLTCLAVPGTISSPVLESSATNRDVLSQGYIKTEQESPFWTMLFIKTSKLILISDLLLTSIKFTKLQILCVNYIVLPCLDDSTESRLAFFHLVKIWDWSKNHNHLPKNTKSKIDQSKLF